MGRHTGKSRSQALASFAFAIRRVKEVQQYEWKEVIPVMLDIFQILSKNPRVVSRTTPDMA
eukprot:12880101-Prorocentrum_lima.AAC.1